MRIGIVGGGITGLATAYNLLKLGYDITVIESGAQIGGLANAIKVDQSFIERFYHHLFSSDDNLISLLDELDLTEHLVWSESQIGYYYNDYIYKFGKPSDLLSFHPLSWKSKIAFGLSVLNFQKRSTWKGLDNISVKDWFAQRGSIDVYTKVWEPLLKLKFGHEYQNISAAWLWGRIHPRAQSRNRFYQNERLGYILGSFQILFKQLYERILNLGGEVLTRTTVETIEPLLGGEFCIKTNKEDLKFDKVIVTAHIPTFLNIVPTLPEDYRQKLQKIRYQSITCMLFILKSSLSKSIYWLNVNDPSLPFGGVIEHTNFISPSEYNNQHLVYVFNYLSDQNPLFYMGKDEIENLYINGLRKIFPSFTQKSIIKTVLSKDKFATPIYSLNYSTLMPSHETPIKNLFLANTAQVYPYDRNVSNCINNSLDLTRLIKTIG